MGIIQKYVFTIKIKIKNYLYISPNTAITPLLPQMRHTSALIYSFSEFGSPPDIVVICCILLHVMYPRLPKILAILNIDILL